MPSILFVRDDSRCQMLMRCELKRTDRPTPQIWSPGALGETDGVLASFACFVRRPERGRGKRDWEVVEREWGGRGLPTLVQRLLELLADGQQLHAGPHVGPDGLGHAKGPRAAVDVAAVLPHGAEALLEEVDTLAHLDVLDRCVVGVAPKVLHRRDGRADLL